MSRWLAVGLTAASVAWVAAIVLAPFGAGDASLASRLVYEAASLICHQRPERSFHLAGVAMPVCARCSALYVSGAAAALAAWAGTPGASMAARRARRLFALAALPMLGSVAAEWLGLAASSSVARAVSAVPFGATAGWIFVRALRRDAPAAARSVDAL
jgi:uncharacterized membrane protein